MSSSMHSTRPTLKSYQLFNDGLIYYPFYESADPNYLFANFWPQSLMVDGQTYATPEHYFHAKKIEFLMTDPALPPEVREHRLLQETMDLICDHNKSPEQIRKAVNVCTNQLRKINGFDFNAYWANKKHEAFLAVIRQRCQQDKTFAKALQETGDAYIVEDTFKGPGGVADIYNGAGPDGMGENQLGFALMHVREERKQQRILTKQEFKPAFEKMRNQARAERLRLDAAAGTKPRGKKFAELSDLAQRLQLDSHKKHPSSTHRTSTYIGRKHPAHVTGFNSVDVYPCDNVSDTTKAASRQISHALNEHILNRPVTTINLCEQPPIIRAGNIKDTFKLAFDNPSDALQVFNVLSAQGYDISYHGDKEKYPMSLNGKKLKHIVRFEVSREALHLLRKPFLMIRAKDKIYLIRLCIFVARYLSQEIEVCSFWKKTIR